MRQNGRKKSNGSAVKILLIIVLLAALAGAAYFVTGKIMNSRMQSSEASRNYEEPEAGEAEGTDGSSEKDAEATAENGSDADSGYLAGIDPERFGSCYIVNTLNRELQENFQALYMSVEAFEETCSLPNYCSEEEAALLVELLHTECPELFQFDSSALYYTTTVMDRVNSVTLPYSMEKEQYIEERRLCEEEITRIVAIAMSEDTEYGREMAAYGEYCNGSVYDLTTARCAFAVGPLVEKKGKCDGISLGFKWLMNELGIPCMVISGDNRIPGELGHAWNMVKIDGEWYCVDVTAEWSETERDTLMYPAFNIAEDWQLERYTIQKDYEALDLPHCHTMEGSFHVKNGSYVTGSDVRTEFIKALNRAVGADGICLLQIEDPEEWEKFTAQSSDWTNQWMEENGVFGNTTTLTIPNYRVAEVRLQLNANSSRINELNLEIETRKAELQAFAEEMDAKLEEINAMVARANEDSQALEEMGEAVQTDGGLVDIYNAMVEDYNALIDAYNAACDEYRRMKEEYNSKYDELNRLIEEYNSLI